MTRILTIVDWYLPGFKAGGPVRSVSNLIAAVGSGSCEFFIFTRDRDLKDHVPFPDVPKDTWVQVGKARVFYAANVSITNLRRRLREVSPDIIYLNSFFSRLTIKVLLLRRLGLLPRAAVVLAPRGEFSPGSLELKKVKKVSFMALAGRFGLYRDLLWHASTQREKREMERVFSRFRFGVEGRIGIAPPIHVASDIPEDLGFASKSLQKKPGQVSFLFVSRVSPKKNLMAAIDMLSTLKGDVAFDVFGPIEDARYWAKCLRTASRVGRNVKVRHLGALPHDEARKMFLRYHFFLFPTLGENFGHVIPESLSAGCPVIISDQTPWTNLEAKNIGWDLPLQDRERWRQVLQQCVEMDNDAYQGMSRCALAFVKDYVNSPRIKEENLALFRNSLKLGFKSASSASQLQDEEVHTIN
jgi:glycosyltransferase involved in cell wall biosynthesis